MSLASMYPSSSGGSGEVLSPLSTPASAPTAPEAQEAPAAPAATQPSPDPQSPPGRDPAAPADPSQSDDEGGIDIDAAIDAAEAAPVQPAEVDMTVDQRPNFFKDVRATEPAPSGPMDYAAVTRLPWLPPGAKPNEGFHTAMAAAAKAGVGITEMQGFFGAFVDAAKAPIRTTPEAAAAALQAELGDRYEAKLASAQAFIGELEKTWPTVRAMLAKTGLGNDPAFIKQIAARAARRGL